MARVVDFNREKGVQTLFHDLGGGQFAVEDRQDVEDIVEFNKAMFNQYDERTPFGERMGDHHVAKIPDVILTDLIRQGILNPDLTAPDERRFLRWLDDPENRAFRTRPGRLSR